MKIKNWSAIEESAGGQKLPAGGYVCRITNVEDIPEKEYLLITYDIIEGEHANHFANDDFAKDNPFVHQFRRSYKETAEGMFKAFLSRLEESNNRGPRPFNVAQWQVYSDERQLIGLEIGLVVQYEKYTNPKGDDKERMNVERIYATQDIRNGDFKVPEPKDSREKVPAQAAAPASNYYNDVDTPF